MYTQSLEGAARFADTVTFKKLMQGTTSSENINNEGASVKSGTSADDAWSIDGNSGNDTITNTGNYVYIDGGDGVDTIDVSADKKGDVFSSHVYQFGLYDGKDTIIGFNENDSIQITVRSGEDFPTIKGDFDSTGKNYVVDVGSATLTLKDYGGGKKIKLINQANQDITSLVGGNYAPVLENGNYIIPRYIVGTFGDDILFNDQDNFTISANSGNDSIVNSGSNVSINDYSGNDTICIVPNGTVYAQNVSIDAGAGDDLIINEFTGNDTIYFFNAADIIQLKDNTYHIGSSVDGTDVTLNFSNIPYATATILLKGGTALDHVNIVNCGEDSVTAYPLGE